MGFQSFSQAMPDEGRNQPCMVRILASKNPDMVAAEKSLELNRSPKRKQKTKSDVPRYILGPHAFHKERNNSRVL